MGGARWPALAIQGVFLAANISFLLAGKNDAFILISTTTLLLLFSLQSVSKNPRFMYLFPVHNMAHKSIPTPGIDTAILKGLIVISVVFFYLGATETFPWIFRILGSGLLITAAVGFPKIWDRHLDKQNRIGMARLLGRETPHKFVANCPGCSGPADYEYEVVERGAQYRQILKSTCKGDSGCGYYGRETVISDQSFS